MKIKLASIALIAIIVMGCNSGKSTTYPSSNSPDKSDMSMVENTKWVISILEGEAVTSKEQNGKEIHFTLNSENKQVTGFSGCNTFMGTYTLKEGNRISFSKMASTRMACPEGDFNEQQFLSIFETADNFTIVGHTLALNKAKRAPLAIFEKGAMEQSPIVGKYWKLKTLEGKKVKMADNQEREIFFTLKSKDNRVTGFAGCNTINGTFTLEEGNRIRFHQMATTLKICPDVDVKESDFLKIFEIADNYTITDDELRLNVGRRAPLAIFEAVYFD